MKKIILSILLIGGAFASHPSILLPGILNKPAVAAKCDQILIKNRFSVCYNYKYRIPTMTFYSLTPADILSPSRKREYLKLERDIPKEYRTSYSIYQKTGYDAGHLPAAASLDITMEDADEVYRVNYCAPQTPKSNRVIWRGIETQERKLALLNPKIYVITGIIPGEQLLNNTLNIPTAFWKIIWIPEKKDAVAWLVINKNYSDDDNLTSEYYKTDAKSLLNILKNNNIDIQLKNFGAPFEQ